MKKETNKQINIIKNYESESVDLTLKCCNYLLENNFYKNEEQDNIELLEKALINYSILKIVDWKIDIEKLEIENWDNLAAILEILNNHIPTEEGKKGFFAQYTLGIIYIYSEIKKEIPIKWTETKDIEDSCIYISENGKIKEIITNKTVSPHKIPTQLLEKIKADFYKEKHPTLKISTNTR